MKADLRSSALVAFAGLILLNVAALGVGTSTSFRLEVAALMSQPWGIWTGHFVHANWYHAGLDIAFLLLLHGVLKSTSLVPYLAVAPILSLCIVFLRPDLDYYLGASGLGYFLVGQGIILCAGWKRLVCVAIGIRPVFLLASPGEPQITIWTGALAPVVEAHAVGLGLGLLVAAWHSKASFRLCWQRPLRTTRVALSDGPPRGGTLSGKDA